VELFFLFPPSFSKRIFIFRAGVSERIRSLLAAPLTRPLTNRIRYPEIYFRHGNIARIGAFLTTQRRSLSSLFSMTNHERNVENTTVFSDDEVAHHREPIPTRCRNPQWRVQRFGRLNFPYLCCPRRGNGVDKLSNTWISLAGEIIARFLFGFLASRATQPLLNYFLVFTFTLRSHRGKKRAGVSSCIILALGAPVSSKHRKIVSRVHYNAHESPFAPSNARGFRLQAR